MALSRRVAGLRGQMWFSPDRKWIRGWIATPLGIGGAIALVAGVCCGVAHVDIGVREATVGELFEHLGYALLILSMAREAGASRFALIMLTIGGVALVAHRLFVDGVYTIQLCMFVAVVRAIFGNTGGLSKEEFERRYYSPPGPLSFSRLKVHLPVARSEEVPPPESDV